jgi:hypothetical protein
MTASVESLDISTTLHGDIALSRNNLAGDKTLMEPRVEVGGDQVTPMKRKKSKKGPKKLLSSLDYEIYAGNTSTTNINLSAAKLHKLSPPPQGHHHRGGASTLLDPSVRA